MIAPLWSKTDWIKQIYKCGNIPISFSSNTMLRTCTRTIFFFFNNKKYRVLFFFLQTNQYLLAFCCYFWIASKSLNIGDGFHRYKTHVLTSKCGTRVNLELSVFGCVNFFYSSIGTLLKSPRWLLNVFTIGRAACHYKIYSICNQLTLLCYMFVYE